MRQLLAIATLFAISAPAFASNPIPEPEMLSLVALGALGMMLVRRRK